MSKVRQLQTMSTQLNVSLIPLTFSIPGTILRLPSLAHRLHLHILIPDHLCTAPTQTRTRLDQPRIRTPPLLLVRQRRRGQCVLGRITQNRKQACALATRFHE
jgi:hypothetical protein